MKYPLGIQSFPDIIEGNYAYVDKTALVHQLIEQGKWYFLSRPRRFGKSLLVSTFESVFKSEKHLFKGLAISKTNYGWQKHPVLKLEFTKRKVQSASDLEELLISFIGEFAAQYDITLENKSSSLMFDELVKAIYKKHSQKIALLVDEYDKPILDSLTTGKLEEVKSGLNGFYAMIKTLDPYLKFAFITGVSKFSQVSVFSGMNNLNDISADKRYATICGYTEVELENAFQNPIQQMAKSANTSVSDLMADIQEWYNGYCFNVLAGRVYNPYSVLAMLDNQEFKNFWYQSATPTFLTVLIKDKNIELSHLEKFEVGESALHAVEPESMDVLAVLLQTGYLTVKSYSPPLYTLGFPNKEVKDSFYDSLAAAYSNQSASLTQAYAVKMHSALNVGDLNSFFEKLNVFLANVSYDITLKNEKYYQSLIFVICKLVGIDIETEVTTNKGRIDAVIKTDKTIYIIEFKLNGSKEQALEQIKDIQYPQKYQNEGKEICMIGVEFDEKERNVGGWVDERF